MSDAAEKWKAKTQDLVLRIKDTIKDSNEDSDLRLTYEQLSVLQEMLEYIKIMERADRRADDKIHSLEQHINDLRDERDSMQRERDDINEKAVQRAIRMDQQIQALEQEKSELSGLYVDGVRQ